WLAATLFATRASWWDAFGVVSLCWTAATRFCWPRVSWRRRSCITWTCTRSCTTVRTLQAIEIRDTHEVYPVFGGRRHCIHYARPRRQERCPQLRPCVGVEGRFQVGRR